MCSGEYWGKAKQQSVEALEKAEVVVSHQVGREGLTEMKAGATEQVHMRRGCLLH